MTETSVKIEILFHGLMAFKKPPNGPLTAAFLRGDPKKPIDDHVVSITLQEFPGTALPGDVLPFPVPLIMRPEKDIHLTVEGKTAPPLEFEPNKMITLNGEGFHKGLKLEIGDRFFPHFTLNNGKVIGADNHEIIVIPPDEEDRDQVISFIVVAQIPLGPSDKAVLKYEKQSLEFPNRGDGTKYRLWVSNFPTPPELKEDPSHMPDDHFQHYYVHGFPSIREGYRFKLKPKERVQRFTYKRPCLGIHIAE